jgi:hypothetical protein
VPVGLGSIGPGLSSGGGTFVKFRQVAGRFVLVQNEEGDDEGSTATLDLVNLRDGRRVSFQSFDGPAGLPTHVIVSAAGAM